MSKRAPDFTRIARDAYATPVEAVAPLLRHLAPRTKFIEPCVGSGALVEHLTRAGHVCVAHYDDAAETRRYVEARGGGVIAITNPPHRRDLMHAIISNVSSQMPLWALIDFDWLATSQASPYLARIRDVAVIGRVKWMRGSKYTGKDNYVWLLFDQPRDGPELVEGQAIVRLFGRAA